jgi:hypothetical protein
VKSEKFGVAEKFFSSFILMSKKNCNFAPNNQPFLNQKIMKKLNLKVAVVLLAGSCIFSSCIGSFSLFNKYAAWQRDMTSNKFVNAIVGFFLMPIVGSITMTVDWLVLNTIEFWSGDNPVASNVGKTQKVTGQDGRIYAVKTLKNGYKVTAPDGVVTLFTYNKAENSWSMSQNGQTREIFRFTEDGKSIRMDVNGQEREFALNEQGVLDAEQTAMGFHQANDVALR